MTQYPSNFCVRPFTELMLDVNGTIAPCCVLMGKEYSDLNSYLNSDYLSSLKKELWDNERTSKCDTCWHKEDKGLWSNREKVPLRSTSDDVANSIIKDVHIKFSNKCNLKCRMCSEYFSSAWGEEKGLTNPVTTLFDDKKLKKQFYDLLPSLGSVTMSGGEPFLSDDHLDFLKVASQVNPKLNLVYNSNMTVLRYKGVYFPDLWDKFNCVTVIASVDGFGDANSYQRYGFNWDKIANNILTAKKYIGHVHATVTIYTIFSLHLLIKWCINNDIPFSLYGVHQDRLNPAVLPHSEKQKVLENFKNLELPTEEAQENVVNFLKSFLRPLGTPSLHKRFKKDTIMIDKKRNQSFIEVVPELKDWYLSIKGE